jgi:NADH dehydrogenase (ubiquinone) 1 beta subcomplex subunit 7
VSCYSKSRETTDTMGQNFSNMGRAYKQPDETPKTLEAITFDPHHGFDYQRKEREKLYTDAEMNALKVPKDRRDYCAHLLIPFHKCRREEWPLFYRCGHEKHAYSMCLLNDQKLRVKEWERERRLRIREKENMAA